VAGKLLTCCLADCGPHQGSVQVYEQIKPDSMFGRQMIRNLEERGAPLHGVHATPTLEAHMDRVKRCGFQRAFAEDLLTLYEQCLDPEDRRRIEGLELFDEFEEWHLIMSHYCICVGVNDASGVLKDFTFQKLTLPRSPAAAPFRGMGMPPRHGLPNAD
jgi:tRNA wybutosine-synthesizing protein 4